VERRTSWRSSEAIGRIRTDEYCSLQLTTLLRFGDTDEVFGGDRMQNHSSGLVMKNLDRAAKVKGSA
jgi:hypothetical protein